MIEITVALPRADWDVIGPDESVFRRITFSRGTFQQCMDAARSFGWEGSVVHLNLGPKTVILTRRKENDDKGT